MDTITVSEHEKGKAHAFPFPGHHGRVSLWGHRFGGRLLGALRDGDPGRACPKGNPRAYRRHLGDDGEAGRRKGDQRRAPDSATLNRP